MLCKASDLYKRISYATICHTSQSTLKESGSTMKIVILYLLLGAAFGAPGKDPTIEEFEKEFHQKFADPKDEEVAAAELAKQEAEIDEENEKYENGKGNFEEELEPWDDLPKEVFEKEKEGLIPGGDRFIPISQTRGMGLIITPEHERVNTPEDRAFLDEIYDKYDRASIPKSWNSKSKGSFISSYQMLNELATLLT